MCSCTASNIGTMRKFVVRGLFHRISPLLLLLKYQSQCLTLLILGGKGGYDAFQFRIFIEHLHAKLTAKTAFLVTAKWGIITEDMPLIDPHRSGFKLCSDFICGR